MDIDGVRSAGGSFHFILGLHSFSVDGIHPLCTLWYFIRFYDNTDKVRMTEDHSI